MFENVGKGDNIFELAVNKSINSPYIFGTIILIIVIYIYFTLSIDNLSNIQSQINTVQSNYSRITTGVANTSGSSWFTSIINKIFSQKNLQIIILGLYFFLSLTFLFLYNRSRDTSKGGYGFLNIFSSTEEKIKRDMGVPIANLIDKVGYVVGAIGLIITLVIIILWIYNKFSKLHEFLNLILKILNYVFVGTIIYKIFETEINRLLNNKTNNLNFFERLLRIIGELIFIIPCLVIIMIDAIKHQIKITTPTVWIVLIIEIIIILLYFLIPILIKNMSTHDGKLLLEGPVFIDKRRMIGTYQNVQKNEIYRKKLEEYNYSLFKSKTDKGSFDASTNEFEGSNMPFNIKFQLDIDDKYSQRFNFNYNYGISLFLYLNPQPINTSRAYVVDTPIFDYASKPKIVFNGLQQQLKFICTDISNLEKTIYETNDIKYQKWMHIVVNYRSSVVDIFIDGTLRATQNNIQPFMEYSKIYVGSNDGIAGGIKNILYFSEPLDLDKINYIGKIMN